MREVGMAAWCSRRQTCEEEDMEQRTKNGEKTGELGQKIKSCASACDRL